MSAPHRHRSASWLIALGLTLGMLQALGYARQWALAQPDTPSRPSPTLIITRWPRPTRTATYTPTITPTSSRTPTATRTPTPRPVNLPLIWRQAKPLQDGGFERGAFLPAWVTSGRLSSAVVRTERHSGSYAALLGDPQYVSAGGCPMGEAAIAQVIEVPANGQPQLRFWYRLYSYDTLDFDYFAVLITSGSETQRVWLDGRIVWNTNLWDSGWQEAAIPLKRYAGKRVTLRFVNAMTNEDGWFNTWTYVDDVSLVNPGP